MRSKVSSRTRRRRTSRPRHVRQGSRSTLASATVGIRAAQADKSSRRAWATTCCDPRPWTGRAAWLAARAPAARRARTSGAQERSQSLRARPSTGVRSRRRPPARARVRRMPCRAHRRAAGRARSPAHRCGPGGCIRPARDRATASPTHLSVRSFETRDDSPGRRRPERRDLSQRCSGYRLDSVPNKSRPRMSDASATSRRLDSGARATACSSIAA